MNDLGYDRAQRRLGLQDTVPLLKLGDPLRQPQGLPVNDLYGFFAITDGKTFCKATQLLELGQLPDLIE